MKITNTTKFQKQTLNLIKLLKIKNATKIVVEMSEELRDTKIGGRMRPTKKNEYLVQLNPSINKNKLIKILAHEMIHVSQYDRGDLEMTVEETPMGKKVEKFWKGKKICLYTTDYLSLPWEMEAHKDMNFIGQKCR